VNGAAGPATPPCFFELDDGDGEGASQDEIGTTIKSLERVRAEAIGLLPNSRVTNCLTGTTGDLR
jgi:hypothetical protein